jgi:L-aspartate oxidase
MGGIATDSRARSNVPGLWAVGEVASTGLHGANRLASNSLLEAVVFAARAAEHIRGLDRDARRAPQVDLKRIATARPVPVSDRAAAVARLRRTMNEHVGVERIKSGLMHAIGVLEEIEHQAKGDSVLANMALAARFIAASALRREESRGAHARSDFLVMNPALAARTFLRLDDLDRRVGEMTLKPAPSRQAGGCR